MVFSGAPATVPTQQLCIQVVRRHQQLQAQLWWDVHVRHIELVLVLLVVQEVFADFLENDATAEGDKD